MAFIDVVNQNLTENDVVLDIGCGDKNLSNRYVCEKLITLDAWEKVNPDILVNLEISDIPFPENSVDVVVMLDFIEHLDYNRGKEIIEQAKIIARKKIVLLTPLWWQDNAENVNNPALWCYGNEYDYHKSLWTLEDFEGWERFTGNPDVLDTYFVGAWTKV